MRKSIVIAAITALTIGAGAAPAEAHLAYWTHLKCVLGAGTTATMDVSHSDAGIDGYRTIAREDYATVRAFKADRVQLMMSIYDFNTPPGVSHYGAFTTIYSWGDGSQDSVLSSFGSRALAGDTHYALMPGKDKLKLKVTDGGEVFACENVVGGGHS